MADLSEVGHTLFNILAPGFSPGDHYDAVCFTLKVNFFWVR